jgi:uncharacterized membrane protein YccC
VTRLFAALLGSYVVLAAAFVWLLRRYRRLLRLVRQFATADEAERTYIRETLADRRS